MTVGNECFVIIITAVIILIIAIVIMIVKSIMKIMKYESYTLLATRSFFKKFKVGFE